MTSLIRMLLLYVTVRKLLFMSLVACLLSLDTPVTLLYTDIDTRNSCVLPHLFQNLIFSSLRSFQIFKDLQDIPQGISTLVVVPLLAVLGPWSSLCSAQMCTPISALLGSDVHSVAVF